MLLNSANTAETEGMPQLNPEFWISQIFWLVLTFSILYLVLSKVILPKISKNLETRKSQILENIETADKQKEESENKIKGALVYDCSVFENVMNRDIFLSISVIFPVTLLLSERAKKPVSF